MAILLDSLRPCPAHVVGRNGDLLAWNPGGLQLLAGIADWPAVQRNVWRYTFLSTPLRGSCSTTGKASSAAASLTFGRSPVSNRMHPTSP